MTNRHNTTISVGSFTEAQDVCRLTKDVVGDDGYFWLQSELLLQDIGRGLPDAGQVAEYTQGRAFSSLGEVRWRKVRDAWTVTVIRDGNVPEGLCAIPGDYDSRPATIALFGQRTAAGGKSWRDSRYPRAITYPPPAADTAWVSAIEYMCRATGKVHFVRWTGFGGQAHG